MSQSYDSLLLGLLQAAHSGAFGQNQPRPSAAQCNAGNYRVGRWQWGGLTLCIEQPEGSVREKAAKDGSGKTWRNVMGGHYGYIQGTKGRDGDAVDCFIGQDVLSSRVFVINQGFGSKFDEHKVMLCYDSPEKARSAYLRSYASGWDGLQSMHECSINQLRWWLSNCDTTKPFNPAHLPFEGAPAMQTQQRTYWDENAMPISTTLDAVFAAMRDSDSGDGLLLDSVTEDDILSDPDNQAVLTMDALVTEFVRLDRRMVAMQRVMNRTGGEIKIAATQVTKPFKQRGIVNVAVIFELTDGQTISVYFHNPDAKTTKVAPNDEIISWKWLLNKKDVTIWVAPERGKDLQVQEVGRRLMKLAAKNSEAFARANEKRAQRLAEVKDLNAEIAELEQQLAQLLAQIETVKAQIELAEEAKLNAQKLAEEFASNPKPREPLPTPTEVDSLDGFKAVGLATITDTGAENLYFTGADGQPYFTKVFEPDNYTSKVGQKVDLAADYMARFPEEFQAPQATPESVQGSEKLHDIAHMALNLSGKKVATLGDLVAALKKIDRQFQLDIEMSDAAFARAYRSHFTDGRIVGEKISDLNKKYPKLKILDKIAGSEAMWLVSSYALHRYYEPSEQSLKNMIADSVGDLAAAKAAAKAAKKAPDPIEIADYEGLKEFTNVLITSVGDENLYFETNNGKAFYTKLLEPSDYKEGEWVSLANDDRVTDSVMVKKTKAVMDAIAHELGLLGWLVAKDSVGYEMRDPYRQVEHQMLIDGRDETKIELETISSNGVQIYTDAYPDSDPAQKAKEFDAMAFGALYEVDEDTNEISDEESEFYGKRVEWVKARMTLEKAAKSVGAQVVWGDFNASLTTGSLFDAAGGYDDVIAQIGADGIVVARASISEFGAVTLYKGADGAETALKPAPDAANTSESEIKAALLAVIESLPEQKAEPEPEPEQQVAPRRVLRILVNDHEWTKNAIESAKKYFVGVSHAGGAVPDGGRYFTAKEGNGAITVELGWETLFAVDLKGLSATQAAQQVEDKAQAAAQKMRDDMAAQAEKERIAREEKQAYLAKVNATRESIGHRFARCSDKFYLWLDANPRCIPVAVALDKEFAQYDSNKDTHVTVYWQAPNGATLDSAAAWGEHADIGAGMWAVPEPDLNQLEPDELQQYAAMSKALQATLDAAYESGGSVCGTVRMGFESYALIQLNEDGSASIFDMQGQPFATPSGASVANVTAQSAAMAASEVAGAAPVPQIPEDLTPVQMAVLLIAYSYKSTYRKQTAQRYGIGAALYDRTVADFNAQGVYLKRSAITKKGKEVVEAYYPAGSSGDSKLRMLKETSNHWESVPQAPQAPVQDAPAAPAQDPETDPENQPPYYTQQPQPVFAVGDYLSATFPSLNKRNSLTDYMLQPGSTYKALCKVEKVLTLSPAEYDRLAENLLGDRDDLGGGGSGTASPYLDESIFRTSRSDMSAEMLHEVDSTLYNLATVVQAKGRVTYIIDAQGYTYARYVALNPVKTSAPEFGAAPTTSQSTQEIEQELVEMDKYYAGKALALLVALRDKYGRGAVESAAIRLRDENLTIAIEVLKRATGKVNSLGGVMMVMPSVKEIVDAVMNYQWKGLQPVKQDEPEEQAEQNPDMAYLQSVVDGKVLAADVDFDALEAMYERNSQTQGFEDLFNRVLDVVQNAEDQATKDL